MLISLEELLSYKNKRVIRRYTQDYPGNTLSATEAFEELLKYLWLARKLEIDKLATLTDTRLNFVCVMHYEMSDIDDMWHTFLLFTKEYMDFCKTHFGRFMHHNPVTEGHNTPTEEQFGLEFTRYLNYINEHLGEKTLLKWFGKLI